MIRFLLLLVVALSCWSCSSLENLAQRYENWESERQRKLCDGLWAIGRGKGTVSGYDKQLVDLVLVTNGAYKLNQDSIAECFHTSPTAEFHSVCWFDSVTDWNNFIQRIDGCRFVFWKIIMQNMHITFGWYFAFFECVLYVSSDNRLVFEKLEKFKV